MNKQHAPIHLDEVAPPSADGALRTVVTGRDGSSTLAWHTEIPPGGALPGYALGASEEIVVLLAGQGVARQDGERAALRVGHCRLIPRGAARSFRNGSQTEPAILAGFWPGAPDPWAAGYEALEPQGPGRAVTEFSQGVTVHLDDVPPEAMDAGKGWSISDFRLPLGAHNGSASTLFRARFLPGAVHRKHRHEACEEIYHVISGEGLAGAGGTRHAVRGGHFHYIPAGVEHWLVNRNADAAVEVVGVYVGAGSVSGTGYVYSGDVTRADLE